MLIADSCIVETDASGKELVAHGDLRFPIAIYHDHLEHIPVDWHWHTELEMIYQIDGESVFCVNDKRILLQKGEGLFINGETLHGGWPTDKQHSDICSLVFHPRLVSGGAESVFWQKYLEPLTGNHGFTFCHFGRDEAEKAATIRRIWEICGNEAAGYEFQVRNKLSDLLYDLYCRQLQGQAVLSPRKLRNSERMKGMLNYVHKSFREPILVTDIAKSVMISESECLRCFRETIKVSPGQYLRQYRISRACELLESSSETVSRIGELCGFSDESYFVKQFREAMGMTPGAYRKMQQK